MTKLVITRGLPGSGKSTWAREWVAGDPAHRAEVNRDAIRLMLHGGFVNEEVQVSNVRDASIEALLKRGTDVVSSDTNLPQRTARDLARIARRNRADVEVIDLTNVDIDLCHLRNERRTDKEPVPVEVIEGMYARYIKSRAYPLPLPADDPTTGTAAMVEYVHGLPYAVIVDIDGTVALSAGRSPYDYTRVHEDRPNRRVIELVQDLFAAGNMIIFMSGRPETCREATNRWLIENVPGVAGLPLYMRPALDSRKDSIVKRELFDKHIRGNYNVLAVLDDRDQVVKMWREELGLTCLQVAYGAF